MKKKTWEQRKRTRREESRSLTHKNRRGPCEVEWTQNPNETRLCVDIKPNLSQVWTLTIEGKVQGNYTEQLQLKLRMEDSVSSSNMNATNVAQAIHTALDWASTPNARQNAVAFLDSVLSSSLSIFSVP